MSGASHKQTLATDQARHKRWARDGRTPDLRAEHARAALECRDALLALRLEDRIQQAINAAPPLGAYQRERLAALLTSPTP
jgi:hypothetical protein